ncbi:type II secretion system protein [Lactobacillus sp. PV034]|uniref:type II secretion system protein n=1 Tax=Lactobacillus sp. PV034 TaxID=2594495 RepID=UPI00223F715B|nr:type II secretion system protein [Lactobacillus sp. PV034]QNQ80679.1 type II secretion system protein [Lactobacillus sp. PV034]
MVKGFLLLESSLGLIICCLTVGLLALTLGQEKQVEHKIEAKVDQALANHIKKTTNLTKVEIHNKIY